MEKVVAIISTDWHIDEHNGDLIKELIRQKVLLAHKYHCSDMICLGDIFESRKSQKEHVLNTLTDILDYLGENKIRLIAIPGNHDKVDYSSYRSYLTPFTEHPNLHLVERASQIDLSNHFKSLFIPFFQEDIWLQEESSWDQPNMILFSHQAITGSTNNNGTQVENKITLKTLKRFTKVFLGHYHNKQQVGQNVYHLPSICQNNFGEDEEKGFTLLFEDGSHRFEKSLFPIYRNIEVDVNDKDFTEKIEQIKGFSKKDNLFLKVKIKGTSTQCDSIDTSELKRLGVSVDLKRQELEVSDEDLEPIFFDTDDDIIDCFKNFCEKESLDFKEGLIYIQKMLS